MALREEIDRRLIEWANWRRVQEVAFSSSTSYPDVGSASGPSPFAEVQKIDRSVALLPANLRSTVIEVYVRPGTKADHALRLGCPEATLVRRLGRAHLLLTGQFGVGGDLALHEHQSALIKGWLNGKRDA